MLNEDVIKLPEHYSEVLESSRKLNFNMLSDLKTGSLLRVLAASKPGGRILELGTGTGLSLCWIAEGASADARIISLDNDPEFQSIAVKTFENDTRIKIQCLDANDWLTTTKEDKFDLIFADAWPGKFEHLDQALALLNIGGFYFIDDLLPQPNWPEGHSEKVANLFQVLISREDLCYTTFNWSTGLMLFTKIR